MGSLVCIEMEDRLEDVTSADVMFCSTLTFSLLLGIIGWNKHLKFKLISL